jgi:uncharacterized protein
VSEVALLVIAKEPRPGWAKTRLTPPCTPAQAAALARASLLDTLEVVASTPAARRVLVFDGDSSGLTPTGFDVIDQRGAGLGDRLAAAFHDVGAPALLIGMDTPQITCEILRDATGALADEGVDAVLGPALDGGYWTVGFSRPAPGAFTGVPMSRPDTCAAQRVRLGALGLRIHEPTILRDLDTFDDAQALPHEAPHTRFARAFAAI